MSPNVGNFVHDLVEMAKATETLPQVQAELEQARRDINNLSQAVQDRELAIQRYKTQIEELNAKVRSLEVERDDASFQVMEAEDTQHNILAMAKAASISLEQMIRKLDPPKPEPEKLVEPQPKAVNTDQGSSDPHPTEFLVPSTQTSGGEDGGKVSPEQNAPDWKQDQAETSRLPQGQGEGNPTTAEVASPGGENVPTQELTQDAKPLASVTSVPEEVAKSDANPTPQTTKDPGFDQSSQAATKKPYEGKKASDYPNWIGYSEWIMDGGTHNSYYL